MAPVDDVRYGVSVWECYPAQVSERIVVVCRRTVGAGLRLHRSVRLVRVRAGSVAQEPVLYIIDGRSGQARSDEPVPVHIVFVMRGRDTVSRYIGQPPPHVVAVAVHVRCPLDRLRLTDDAT